MSKIANIADARKTRIAPIGAKPSVKKVEAKEVIETKGKVKVAPEETVTTKTVTTKVPAKKVEAKLVVIELEKLKEVKNSVVYSNGSGQSIYLLRNYMGNPDHPPASIKLTVEEIY